MNPDSSGGNIGKDRGSEELQWGPWPNEGEKKVSIIIMLVSIALPVDVWIVY